MINEHGEEVFVHCTTGISRVSTLVLVYLAIYCRHKQWNNVDALKSMLKNHYDLSFPNMQAVNLCIEKSKQLQEKNRLRFEADQKNKKSEKDELERRKQLKIAQDEAEKIRLQRLADMEAEKMRQLRGDYETKQKDLRDMTKKEENELNERLRRLRE